MKRYKTNRGALSTIVKVGDKSIRIKFIAGNADIGYFETNDLTLQKAIEQDGNFGVKFFDDTPLYETELDITIVDSVYSWQEARKFLLNEPYNISPQEITSPKKIKSVAKSLNLQFKNLE